MAEKALAGLRVVEYGQLVSAPYAGKLMADLGADVVKIEPRGGDPARQRGPFPDEKPNPECSGLFLYLNSNKRGITLDPSRPEGRHLLHGLIEQSDVLVHNAHPREMGRLGLDFEALRERNPRLVMTSVTPFGLHGAHSNYEATDLVLWAAGGVATLNGGGPGSDEMPPLKAFGSQADFQGGVNAGIATLAAVFETLSSGCGQHVDVSIQECVASILELTFEYWPYQGLVASRLGAKPIQPLDFLECQDGWIFLCCVEEHQWENYVEMMGSPDWAGMELFENRLARGANWDALRLLLNEWTSSQKVDDLYRAAQARRIPIAPVSTMGDLLGSPHLRARGFFAVLDHPRAGSLRYPGAPYKFSVTPWELNRPAPLLGQHNEEIYGRQLGLSPARIAELRKQEII